MTDDAEPFDLDDEDASATGDEAEAVDGRDAYADLQRALLIDQIAAREEQVRRLSEQVVKLGGKPCERPHRREVLDQGERLRLTARAEAAEGELRVAHDQIAHQRRQNKRLRNAYARLEYQPKKGSPA